MRIMVTGGTRGIGEAIVQRLAADGHTVVVGGRSLDRVDAARRRVRDVVPDADLDAAAADLSSVADVDRLATTIDPVPDVVVSNAAVSISPDVRTSEGLPVILATNHLAPWHLLRTLVDRLGPRPARFVVVAASPRALTRVPVDLDDLEARDERALGPVPSLRPFVAYGRTKNMNVMTVQALARRLTGRAVTVHGAHPGIIRGTGLGRHDAGALCALARVAAPFFPGADHGADTPAWLATSDEVAGVSGRFWVRRHEVPTAGHTTEVDRCERLWAASERLVRSALERRAR